MKTALIIILVILIGGAGAAYFYFKGSDKHLQLIPKDAAMVGTIDCISLASKADLKKLQEYKFFKDLEDKTKNDKTDVEGQKWMDIIKNPLSSGINLLSQTYFYIARENDKSVFAWDVDIKDENQFRATLKKFVADNKIVSEKNYRAVYNDSWALAWNSTGLLFAAIQGDGGKDTEKKFFDESFSREKSASILSNSFFKEFESTQKDIGIFMNMGEYMKMMNNLSSSYTTANPLSPILEKMWKDSYIVFNTTFEDGRVHSTWTLKSDNKDIDKINYLKDKGLPSDMLSDVTNKDAYALMSFSLSPQKMLTFFDQVPSWKDMEEEFAQKMGLDKKDIATVFGGDFALSLNDFVGLGQEQMDPAMYNYYMKQYGSIPDYVKPHDKFPRPVFSFNFSSNNKAAVKKMVGDKMTKRPDSIYVLAASPDYTFYLVENKNGFTYTDDSLLAQNILTNHSLIPVRKDLNDMASNYPATIYFNLDFNNYPLSLRNYMLKNAGESFYNPVMTYAKILKDMRMNGDFKGGEANLNLTDGKGNSLYRLIAQFDEAYKIASKPPAM